MYLTITYFAHLSPAIIFSCRNGLSKEWTKEQSCNTQKMGPILSSDDRLRRILISIVSEISDLDRDVASFTLPISIKEIQPYPC